MKTKRPVGFVWGKAQIEDEQQQGLMLDQYTRERLEKMLGTTESDSIAPELLHRLETLSRSNDHLHRKTQELGLLLRKAQAQVKAEATQFWIAGGCALFFFALSLGLWAGRG